MLVTLGEMALLSRLIVIKNSTYQLRVINVAQEANSYIVA